MKSGRVPGLDKPVSRLAQGTMMISSAQLDRSFALLDAVLALGGNAFDTAHVYANGDCDRTLGRWIQERGIREQVVIIAKGAHPNADRNRVTTFDITADLHDSLARLMTDHIDIYLLHRDDVSKPVGPIVEVLNEHCQAGLIRAFGGSNWTHQRIQAANAYAEAHGLRPFSMSSSNYSLAEQVQAPWPGCVSVGGQAGAAAREWYRHTQMPLLTWSSLAGGFFSGRFQRDNLDRLTRNLDRVSAQAYGCEANFQRLERAQALAEEKGVTAAQVALAYLFHQPLNIFALVGCETPAEFAQNVQAAELDLAPEQLTWLEAGTPNVALS